MNSSFDKLRRRGWRDWLGALVLLGLLTRALVPAGFMPVASHGEIQLVLCSIHTTDRAHVNDPAPRGSDHAHCPFALMGAARTPPACDNSGQPLLLAIARFIPPDRATPKSAPARYAAARGPPSQA